MKNLLPLVLISTGLLSGCLMGPKYRRPAANVPPSYRAASPEQTTASSLGNEQWWQVYQDPVLAELIHKALAQNYDVRIATARILEAQAQLRILLPTQFPPPTLPPHIFTHQNPN